MAEQFVIVGGGLAGAMAAQTLREEGFAGQITLISDETERPYERPALSKAYLMGKEERESVFVHPAAWYADHNVTLMTGVRATAVDPAARTVTTADGKSLPYTKLLLATGSTPRPLPVPGAELDGVLYLRTLADSDRLRSRLVEGANVVVVGGGWIGAEVAAAARNARANVTMVETASLPLLRVLGPEVAKIFADLHEANGVRIISGASVRQVRGTERVEAVELADGTELPADLVVAGIGVRPNVDLATAAGVEVDGGVLTDAALRSSNPDIYAAGDVANATHPMLGRRLRMEHVENARHSGVAAAKAMLGQQVAYDRVPFFYSDQYDLGMEYRGYAGPEDYDRVVFRGSPEVQDGKAPTVLAFWTRAGCVLAAMNVNSWDEGPQLRLLIRAGYAGRAVDLDQLADPQVPLDSLID